MSRDTYWRTGSGARDGDRPASSLALPLHPGIRPMALIFGLALAIRLGYLAITSLDAANWLLPDSVVYREIARGIVETGEFVRIVDADSVIVETERVPAYPLFLVPFLALFGNSVLAPLVGQAVVGAITCVLIGLIAREFDERAFLAAGLLAAACLNMIAHDALILTETLFLFFFTLHLWTAARFLRCPGLRGAALSGLWIGMASMTRVTTLYWIPLFAAFIAAYFLYRKRATSAAMAYAAAAFVCASLVLLPQYVRNYSQFGHWQLVSQKGVGILYWYVPLVMDFTSGIPWDKGVTSMRNILRDEIEARGLDEAPANPFARSDLESAVGRRELIQLGAYPILYGWTAGAVINLMTPSLASASMMDKMDRPRFYQTQGANFLDKAVNFLFHPGNRLYLILMVPGILLTLALRVMFVVGVWHRLKRPISPVAILLLGAIGYFLAVTGPLVNAARYRIPMEPAIIVFTAVGLLCLWDWRRRKQGAAA